MDWNVVDGFFNTDHGKGLLKKAMKKEALDQDQYYEADKQGPTQDEVQVAHPGGGENTQVSNSGGGGEGVYDVPKSDVPATGPCADSHVETISEVAPVVEDVARRDPTGAAAVKGIAKKAEEKGPTLLQKLAQVANELDEKGLTEEADMIDAIIREETGAEVEEAPEATETETPEAETPEDKTETE